MGLTLLEANMLARFLGFVVILLVLSIPLFAQGDDDKVRKILERSSSAWRKLKSLQCDSSQVYVQEKTDLVPSGRYGTALRQFIQGGKYRTESYNNLASPTGKADSIDTYDGVKEFNFSNRLDRLFFKTKSDVAILVPGAVYHTFRWVGEPGKLTWQALQSEATWQAAGKRARLVENVKEGDVSYEVLEIATPNADYPKLVHRVYFQTDLDYFPRKHDTFDGETPLWSSAVVEYARLRLGDQSLIVPLEVCHRELRPSVKYVADFYLDKDSLRLNSEIDAKLFTLSTEGISVVVDGDKMP
jgi:hypothetical protein